MFLYDLVQWKNDNKQFLLDTPAVMVNKENYYQETKAIQNG